MVSPDIKVTYASSGNRPVGLRLEAGRARRAALPDRAPPADGRYESAAQMSVIRPDQVKSAVRGTPLKSTTFTVVPANR